MLVAFGVGTIMSTDTLLVYGANWCPDCRRAKKFLGDQRIPFEWLDLEQRPELVADVESRNDGKRIIPTIVFPDGTHLAEPSNDELADKLGLPRTADSDRYDLVIVGGGPASLTAAIYAARENISTLVIEKSALGGQAGVTDRLDNYPGFPDGVGGAELADRMARQAQRYGVETVQAVAVTSIERRDPCLVVSTSTGQKIEARAILIATGSTYRRLGVDGEDDLIGSGIHFCATCDGPFYKGAERVVVIGGGNSGLEEGLFLTQFAEEVHVVEFAEKLAASRLLQDKVANHPRMRVAANTETTGFESSDDGKLAAVLVRDRATGEERRVEASGAFVFIGLDPNTGWLGDALTTDPRGFIETDSTMATSMPGVFAAGDVRSGSTKQLASAVGEGAAVALQIRHHLDQLAEACGAG
jgi:thioredoxin reductase (NADPH)